MKACVTERLTLQTLDLEVHSSSLVHRVFSLDKELYPTLSLFTQVYKWVPVTYCWGQPCDGPKHAIQGGVVILLGMLHATETGISFGCLGLWLVCVFTYILQMFKFQRHSCNLFFLFPPRCQSTLESLLTGYPLSQV